MRVVIAWYGSQNRETGGRITTMSSWIGDKRMTRRWLIAAAAALPMAPLSNGNAQGGESAIVGTWTGEVEGVGGARLIVTAVKPGGQLEGRMEFDLQSFVSQFGDVADAGPNKANYGKLSGSELRIESALGGTYDLTLQGNLLTGTYIRGTTFRGKAAFRKS
jgi:hypothetical protein